jgi:hypothetical protein
MTTTAKQEGSSRRAEKAHEDERFRARYLKRRLRDTYGIYRLKRWELFVVYRHYYDFWRDAEYQGASAR